MKDFLGNEVHVGDRIVFATRKGAALDLHHGTARVLNDKDKTIVATIYTAVPHWKTGRRYMIRSTISSERIIRIESAAPVDPPVAA